MTTLKSATTPHHACAVRWCPRGDSRLVVANYEFDAGQRRGAAHLYDADLQLLASSPDVGGVYDVAWVDTRIVCATADG